MNRLTLFLATALLCASQAFAFLGPSATQVSVNTNSLVNLDAGGSTLQGILAWIDANMLVISSAYATEGYVAANYVSLTNSSTMNSGTTNSLYGLTVRHDQTVSSNATTVIQENTVTATNGQALVFSGSLLKVTSTGQTNNGTITVTLPVPAALNQYYLMYNAKASTNFLAVASSGTLAGPALSLAAGEMAILLANATNTWIGIGQ